MKMPTPRVRNPVHPGEVLEEEFLKPLELTQSEFARRIGTTHAVVNEICRGKRGVSPKMALRFAAYFKSTPEMWMAMQASWDLWQEWVRMQKKAG
jgi:addiction module HigA family antidote